MSKKSFPLITSQDEAWDNEVNDTVEILENQPFPITNYATIAALPAENQNEEGLASVDVNDDVDYTGPITVISDGTVWDKLAWQSTEVTELSDNSGGSANDTVQALTDPADTPADADALRDDLVANLIPELRNNYADLTGKINGILAAMKNTGAMASA